MLSRAGAQTERSKGTQVLPGHLTCSMGIKGMSAVRWPASKPLVLLGRLGKSSLSRLLQVHSSACSQKQPVSCLSLMFNGAKMRMGVEGVLTQVKKPWTLATGDSSVPSLPCLPPALEFRSLEGRFRGPSALHLGLASAWHRGWAWEVSITQPWSEARSMDREVTQERCDEHHIC